MRKHRLDQGLVRVEILRKTKPAELFADDSKRRGPDAKGDVAGFRIIDNGMGFNDENMKSFNTLDSDHKISKGGRGVGRLLWLKSFKLVQVESVFKADDGKHKQRRFRFDAASGVSREEAVDGDEKVPTGSIIHLDGFDERYRAYTRKTGKAISRFVATRAPRYRPILSRIPEDQLNVDPDISDKDLDLTLHKHFASLEAELLSEGHDIMAASPGEDFSDYEARLREYLNKADDIKKSDLASYVSHRRVILDLFEKATQRDANGNYVLCRSCNSSKGNRRLK